VEKETQAMAQAMVMAQAKGARQIKMEGQEEGEHQHDTMGVYELMEGKVVNERAVWQLMEGASRFLYYAQRQKPGDCRWHWFISDRESMEAGEGLGFVKVASSALTPDKATETWEVGNGIGAWYNAPKMEALSRPQTYHLWKH
jgi:hypothetical protein